MKLRPNTSVLGSFKGLGLVVRWMTSLEGSTSSGLAVEAASGWMLYHRAAGEVEGGRAPDGRAAAADALRALAHRGRSGRSMSSSDRAAGWCEVERRSARDEDSNADREKNKK